MTSEMSEQSPFSITQDQLFALVRGMRCGSSGLPDDENPLPPGPWDPIIRTALENNNTFGIGALLRGIESIFSSRKEPWGVILASILSRHPEIWDAIGGGGQNFGEEVALNPQPLPPRSAFLASVTQAMVSRAELLQEIADATMREGEQQGIIIVGGYIARFADDFCGTEFKLKYPFPGPRPHWFTEELDGTDLVLMAEQLDRAAKEAYSPDLRQHLEGASAKFVDAGLQKMQ